MKIRAAGVSWMTLLMLGSAIAQEPAPQPNVKPDLTAAERVERATKNMGNKQLYSLVYKLQKGETVRWTVEHVASTKTQMSGETEETSSRSLSTKAWTVSNIDSVGNMTFDHSIEGVDMWQKIGEDEPVTYNSKTDKVAPFEYESIADKLGRTLATISIGADGQIKDKKTDLKGGNFGVGEVTIPLPPGAIPVGQKWNVPKPLSATDEDNRTHDLKARMVYELVKVKDGNAYISFKTEILTPIESNKIKSQIMQQKTKGFVVFDIKNGRPIRKEIEWDEKVQGYEGPDSFLQYLGRMTEKIVDSNLQQATNSVPLTPLKREVADESAQSTTGDDKPVIRK